MSRVCSHLSHGPEVMSGLVLTWARAILMSLASITTKVYGHVHSTLLSVDAHRHGRAWHTAPLKLQVMVSGLDAGRQ